MKLKWLWLLVPLAVLVLVLLLLALPKETPSGTPAETTHPTETTQPTETTVPAEETKATEETDAVAQTTPSRPEDLPPVVELPVETDPATGQQKGITFPATVEGYQLVIEKLAPYDGLFVEDGSNVQVTGVAMLLLHNKGNFPVEYAEITVAYENVTLLFHVTALPVGGRMVVQERNGQPVPAGEPKACKALVVQRAELAMAEETVRITENEDNSITVTNLTDKPIPTVRLFYKYYMPEQALYVGGIAFTVRLQGVPAGASMTVHPAHYQSGSCKVVMVQTYDEEA